MTFRLASEGSLLFLNNPWYYFFLNACKDSFVSTYSTLRIFEKTFSIIGLPCWVYSNLSMLIQETLQKYFLKNKSKLEKLPKSATILTNWQTDSHSIEVRLLGVIKCKTQWLLDKFESHMLNLLAMCQSLSQNH